MERSLKTGAVDASVMSKWLIPETLTEEALRLRDEHARR